MINGYWNFAAGGVAEHDERSSKTNHLHGAVKHASFSINPSELHVDKRLNNQ